MKPTLRIEADRATVAALRTLRELHERIGGEAITVPLPDGSLVVVVGERHAQCFLAWLQEHLGSVVPQ